MSIYKLDKERYAQLARQAAAEGCVLLKNDNQALPLRKNDRVAVFGRIASTYYKSGLGSGGMVNTAYVTGILDALRNEPDITVEEKVRAVYDEWTASNPFDEGSGWGNVPWSQKEMPVSDALFAAAEGCDAAIVVIGRTAGEDQDNKEEAGSYLLTDAEKDLLDGVCQRFERTIVLLNVGNIIDMGWVKDYQPKAVLYVWQGGQEGGNGIADVLLGRVNPCGKLTDTIAYEIADYPSFRQFGHLDKNYYEEDIYVGYRYFETFAKDRVHYPFGFGLSYTTFALTGCIKKQDGDSVTIEAAVENTGTLSGKEVVQVYVSAPQGMLGKPAMVLSGFAKTKELAPGEKQTLSIRIPKEVYASYDDSGKTGHRSAFVLEEGDYTFFVGNSVRNVAVSGVICEPFTVIRQCAEALAPVEGFERIRPIAAVDAGQADGTVFAAAGETDGMVFAVGREAVPTRTASPQEKLKKEREHLAEVPYTKDKGYKLGDVYEKRVTLDDFVAQLSDEELLSIQRGEGMCSPKVTPGTAAAFGGVTDALRAYGIPALCASDGPSGIRMDCGTLAFSLPNGTLLGCTFNLPLVQELYEMTGRELRQNRIDTLLGPGINIHRHPLNGRNFEYISEDVLLTGKMAVAQLLGLQAFGACGTVKHFSANNQETKRREVNAVVSERALREIYLKVFEIAVKEAGCRSVMTTYGPLNGLWTAGCYDLNTAILRGEWGFAGIVMTDWWAAANDEGKPDDMKNRAAMAEAQNDLVMVTKDASDQTQDNLLEALKSGRLTRAQLARNAKNTLKFALQSVAMQYELNLISEEELAERKAAAESESFSPDEIEYYEFTEDVQEITLSGEDWQTTKGAKIVFGIKTEVPGGYELALTVESDLDELAQLPVTVYRDGTACKTVSFRGTNGATVTERCSLGFVFPGPHYIKLYFGATGIRVKSVQITLKEAVKLPF